MTSYEAVKLGLRAVVAAPLTHPPQESKVGSGLATTRADIVTTSEMYQSARDVNAVARGASLVRVWQTCTSKRSYTMILPRISSPRIRQTRGKADGERRLGVDFVVDKVEPLSCD